MTTRQRYAAALSAIVIARSVVFVFAPGSQFDSDQAVTGLMAKHLSELRAFPVFWYGQTYMLGVEAWLAAPLMAIFGATVTSLKLPLLVINVLIALLLYGSLVDGERIAPPRAAFATLFFALAAPITAAHYLTANGGNVEPCLYVLLLWRLRRRPLWFGLVLGIGFLNREFTIYGAIALLLIDAARGALFTREAAGRYIAAFATAAAAWLVVMFLRHYSSAAGPGTSMADLSASLAANNLGQIVERLCLDPRAIASGAAQIFTSHWPELFGLARQPLTDFGIESTVWQGAPGLAWLLCPVLGVPIVTLIYRRWHDARTGAQSGIDAVTGRDGFCAYLWVVSALSIAGYLVGRCGVIDFHTMRYELLSPLGAAALAALFLAHERSRLTQAIWVACTAAVFVLSATAHVRLLAEYASRPPVPLKQELIRALDARGIRYAYADYWTAYYVTFMTRERIVVASDAVMKVRADNRLVDAHRTEAIRISRTPCRGGEQLTPAFWACGG